MFKSTFKYIGIVLLSLSLAGCTFIFQSGRRSDKLKINELNAQLDELSRSKKMLEDKFSQEISDKQIKLQMMEKGLVITVVGDLLFDSGKAKIRTEAYPLMNKVAGILKDNMSQFNVGIEGYTDNQPIRHSGWKSNWELSTARSLAVLHYLVNDEGLSPDRLSAIGYGRIPAGCIQRRARRQATEPPCRNSNSAEDLQGEGVREYGDSRESG